MALFNVSVKLDFKVIKGVDGGTCYWCGAYGYDGESVYDGFAVELLGKQIYLCTGCTRKLKEMGGK